MLKFFRIPFATAGDKTSVPDATDPSGYVSYQQGYGPDYQLINTNPASKNIERAKMNDILYGITTAIGEIQASGVPDFITTALNGGTAYSYAKESLVRWTDGYIYRSKVAANTSTPADTTKWERLIVTVASDPTFVSNGESAASTGWVRSAMGAIATAAGFAVLISNTGYIKFPSWLGGLIIQWGTATTIGDGSAVFNYPIPMPTQTVAFYCNYLNYGNFAYNGVTVQNSSTSQARAYLSDAAGTPVGGANIAFLVIGN